MRLSAVIEVVAVSDAEHAVGDRRAFGCPLYDSWEQLLAREAKIDFAFAFGRHSEMPAIGEALVERRIPFALEKPCGVRMAQITRLRELAEAANVYAAVPFIFRISDFLSVLRDVEGRIPSDFNYMSGASLLARVAITRPPSGVLPTPLRRGAPRSTCAAFHRFLGC